MASGRSMQLTKQLGEYLVAAELARRGFVATTFAGNVPDFDIVAVDSSGRMFLVQVKTIQRGNWQLNAGAFLRIRLDGGVQEFVAVVPSPVGDLVYVFVKLGEHRDSDQFYAIQYSELQEWLRQQYFPDGAPRTRPRNPSSFHWSISSNQLEPHRDRWELFLRGVGAA